MKMLLVFNHFDDFLLLFTTGVNFVPFVSYHLVSVTDGCQAQQRDPRSRRSRGGGGGGGDHVHVPLATCAGRVVYTQRFCPSS